ncbi:MAG: three-Cys-motif partner protein TcmP [Ardenticatenaceae bacterium]|nr:three-Cys-motif partner protein TcmP [Ardenticatenaceae bacterium]
MTQYGFSQQFGGDWTEIKLQKIEKYLRAYAQIMKDRKFVYAYIDAFAGTGYRTLAPEDKSNLPLALFEEDSQKFKDGSARIALQVTPRFSKYIFIEKDPDRTVELNNLKDEFPHLANDINIIEL